MKKIIVIITSFLLIACENVKEPSTSFWYVYHKTDEFKEETGEKYIIGETYGTYNNYGRYDHSNGVLEVLFRIKNENIAMNFNEQYLHGIQEAYYKMKIKDEDGVIIEDSFFTDDSHFISSDEELYDKLLNTLKKGGNIKFSMLGYSNTSTGLTEVAHLYFEIPKTDGLIELLDSIK